MKIVVNGDFGGYGFGVSNEFRELVDNYVNDRANSNLINFVENYPDACGDLTIVEIPDNATDFDIMDYDGMETLIYVVDGKIHYAS